VATLHINEPFTATSVSGIAVDADSVVLIMVVYSHASCHVTSCSAATAAAGQCGPGAQTPSSADGNTHKTTTASFAARKTHIHTLCSCKNLMSHASDTLAELK